ncbi:hypothetical protein HNO51_12205 [Billgrantia sulfidoxydans]|uniref:protein O-GlcNAc transferase n=1 Tax=Billgrantia sulfidoxydans TaxID=2733484 RepID=A0ABX7W8Q9_9GAMM|nr:glycosyltransferase family 41 protein [Halomonas sulfidoxydans]QTP55379.1 hypothetical protein HNO51_12205 [Halomonas sulfidoxydans]
MAKKNARRRYPSPAPQAGTALPADQLDAFDSAYRGGDYLRALQLAEAMVRRYPKAAQAHELHANVLGRLERFADACEAMAQVIDQLAAPGAAQRLKLAQYQVLAGQAKQATAALHEILKAESDHLTALVWMSRAYHQLGDNRRALEINDRALALDAYHEETLLWRSRILEQLKRHDDALETLKRLLEINPKHVGVNNHIAALYVKESEYEKAEFHYNKELKLNPSNRKVYSNLLVAAHYNPAYSAVDLYNMTIQWGKQVAMLASARASTLKNPAKKIRVGLLSGGFRMHPVGQMILPALENLPAEQFELIAYSTNQVVDKLTQCFQNVVCRWEVVEGLSAEQLDQKIRHDAIDILIDMNGAGEGSRYDTLTREPAPLIVKWVGSLISTTGLSCFDYLLSDSIETPEGVDDLYVEKLIRLPDDYICYHIPEHAPSCNALPALSNGYITFGCLNNPAKLSPPMLAEWAKLLNDVSGSKLLLRGIQFESARYRDKITNIFAEHGVASDRLLLEGPAQHQEFMATYQRIDIALDTWPYSGGLTTCEALMMGVPVVTRVGPTFAGRHSATHLVNAGLPELVTDDWEEFRKRVKELASDLPNLAVIRAALRTILTDSPICDGPRFAKHLTTALRAIWQRHCEGKAPTALTFTKSGQARFEGVATPVALPNASQQDEGFDWKLESTVTVFDNGCNLASRSDAEQLLGSGKIALLAFDPAGCLQNAETLSQFGELHHYPQVTLGDGQPVTLRVGDDPEQITSLMPLTAPTSLTQEHAIPSIALDSIEGLESIDLLALDDRHDSLAILKHGENALQNLLVLQARINFVATHQHQLDFACISQWAKDHGLRFLRFNTLSYQGNSAEGEPQAQVSQLASADALFIPESTRMAELSGSQHKKLAFLLHSVYCAKDTAYEVLNWQGKEQAQDYLRYWKKGVVPLPLTSTQTVAQEDAPPHDSATSARIFNQIEYPLIYNIEILNNGVIDSALAKVGAKKRTLKGIEGLLSAASKKDAQKEIFFTGHSFYNTMVNSPPYVIKQNVFDLFGITPFSIIDDHAYADFMLPRCLNSPDSIIIGSKSARLIEEFKQVGNAKKIKGIVIPHKAPEIDPVLYKDKQNIAVFVGKLYPNAPKSTTSIIKAVAKEKKIPKSQQQAICEFIEKRRSDPFAEPTLERGVTTETTLLYFDLVDKHFRNKYRTAQLEKLSSVLAARGIKTVVIGGKKSEWPFKKDQGCVFYDRMEYKKALHIMNRARYNINLTPSYPDLFTDRAINMMGSNSLCLSDYTPFLESHNKKALYFGHEWLENDFEVSDCQELAMKQKLEILKTYNAARIESAWISCLEQIYNS